MSKRTKPPADTIEISWHIDDVKELRPDLSDAQAREVLKRAKDQHDASIGINWEVLAFHADHLFPVEGQAMTASNDRSKTYRVRFQEITCYALNVTATSESAAIAVATDKFYGLSLADRADAIVDGGALDYFETEEGGAL